MSVLGDRIVDRSMGRNIPLSVHVDLTMRCNELCVHCYRTIEDRDELTTAEVEDLLAQLARVGTLYLTFSGGEIFLRRDLLTIIECAKRLRFDVRLKSNALLVTPVIAARLRELGVRQIDVSIYSADPRVHDAVTKVPGSLARSLQGVQHMRDAGLRVKLNCPVMTVNVDGYREVRELAEGLGVACGFDPMITARNDGDRAPVRLRVRGQALLPLLLDPALNPKPTAPTTATPARPRADLDDITCGAGHNACYVSAYGDVMPCVAMPLACGNIREAPFAEIWWNSKKLSEVRAIRIRDLHTCSGCGASKYCARCPGQALVEDGDLYGPSRAWCEQTLTAARAAGDPVVPASFGS
jgi:radical SAM protein with 4Fe4S-binding SPASM domain